MRGFKAAKFEVSDSIPVTDVVGYGLRLQDNPVDLRNSTSLIIVEKQNYLEPNEHGQLANL